MNWNGYTVFTVLSGGIIIVAALAVRGASAKDRFYGLIAGAGFTGYGIFAASQTSGTFLFPIWIFLVPPAAIGYLVLGAMNRRNRRTASGGPPPAGSPAPRSSSAHGGQPVRPPADEGGRQPAEPYAPGERPVAWAPPPPLPPAAKPDNQAFTED